jgi:HemY protein
MRTWFWMVLTISLAVFVASVIHRFPANMLIVVDQWRVQVSLAFGVLFLIAAFASLYLLIRVLLWLSHMPQRYRGWKGQRQEKREQGLLEQGWTALLEGRYTHAEKPSLVCQDSLLISVARFWRRLARRELRMRLANLLGRMSC